MESKGLYRFHEEQRFRQWWLWLLIAAAAGLQWWGFYEQIVQGKPWGNKPAPDWMMVLLWLGVGNGLPILFYAMRLVVTVTDQEIDIHFRPLIRRRIPIADVSDVEARKYSPLVEFGGWGIRGLRGNRAYNISGRRGVALVLTDGSRVMIGSRRAEALAEAITTIRSLRERGDDYRA